MQILLTWFIAAAAANGALPLTGRITRSDPVLVRSVLDGDTLDVATVGRVRLLGIDAPEIGRGFDTTAPFSREARDRLAALVLRRFVRLEQDGPAMDTYSRRLAYVVLEDGVFVNAALVREGLARVSARLPLRRLDELKRAEAEAQASRRGMWGPSPQIPPPGYTRRSARARAPSVKARKPRVPRRSSRKKPERWQRFPSSTRPNGRSGSATSSITASTTGRFGSSSSSSRPGR
jgi:micrococcal nuclease